MSGWSGGWRIVGAGATALVVLIGTAASAGAVVRNGSATPASMPDSMLAATGRWESSLGAEILVPAEWNENDLGCLSTNHPSVVRYPRFEFACLTPEEPTKEVAILANTFEPDPGIVGRAVEVDGVPAVRSEWRKDDGRYAGTIDVPSRGVAVTVRTLDATLTTGILDSFRLVPVDHAGCPERRPREATPVNPGASATFVPANPTAVVVCAYHTGTAYSTVDGRLRASWTATGADAVHLAELMNAAPSGANPDPSPEECTPDAPADADAILLVHAGGPTVTVGVTFSPCTGRGLSNGSARAQVTMTLVWAVMAGVGGFTLRTDLPD
jgi:hypothetical protein